MHLSNCIHLHRFTQSLFLCFFENDGWLIYYMINLPVVIFFTLLLGGNWSLVITWQASILICCFKIINNIKCAEYLEKKKVWTYFVYATKQFVLICIKQTELMVTWDYACQEIRASRSQPPTPTSCLQTGGKKKKEKTNLLAFSVPNLFLNLEWTSDHSELNWENIFLVSNYSSCRRCCCY